MKFIFFILLIFSFTTLALATTSPYTGEESREIKSLSFDDIQSLRSGKGMGFAKVAELNQYPGPRHVLDLAKKLHLSDDQLFAINAIFEKMSQEAIQAGEALISQEKKLDNLFSSKQISDVNLGAALREIGALQARLRGIHLGAHLATKTLLTHHQILLYDKLRGYTNGVKDHFHGH